MSTLLWIWGAASAVNYVLFVGAALTERDAGASVYFRGLVWLVIFFPAAPLVSVCLIVAIVLQALGELKKLEED